MIAVLVAEKRLMREDVGDFVPFETLMPCPPSVAVTCGNGKTWFRDPHSHPSFTLGVSIFIKLMVQSD